MLKIKNTYSIDEIAETLNVGRDSVKREIDKGKLEAIKIGKQYRITLPALKKYLGERFADIIEYEKIDEVEATIESIGNDLNIDREIIVDNMMIARFAEMIAKSEVYGVEYEFIQLREFLSDEEGPIIGTKLFKRLKDNYKEEMQINKNIIERIRSNEPLTDDEKLFLRERGIFIP